MVISIYNYSDYIAFMKDWLNHQSPRRGAISNLAKHLRCQASFISQVLSHKNQLSFEHAIAVASYMRLDSQETRMWMALVQLAKSGSQKLREFYQNVIDEIHSQREEVKSRIKVADYLTNEDQYVYYSNWWYSAIHVCCSLAFIKTPADISNLLKIDIDKVHVTLKFLLAHGLVEEANGVLSVGKNRVHVGSKSPMVARHHVNWRQQMIHDLFQPKKDEVHYTGVLAISEKDFSRLRSLVLETIDKTEEILIPSPEETVAVLTLDFKRILTSESQASRNHGHN